MNSKKRFSRNRLFKSLRITLIVLASLTALLLLSSYILEKKMKTLLVREINKQLTAEVKVGKIDLSLIRRFPQVSLHLSDVHIESLPGDTAPLLKARHLLLRFNLLRLIRGNYTLKHIELADGNLNLLIPEKGDPNYLILKSGDGSSTSQFSLDLRRVSVRNLKVQYRSVPDAMVLRFFCRKNTLKGQFSSDEYILRASGKLRLDPCLIAGYHYFTGQEADLNLHLNIDNTHDRYTFQKGDLDIEGLPFTLTGTVTDQPRNGLLDLVLEGRKMNLRHLSGLLPGSLDHIKEQYDFDGDIAFRGTITGGYSNGNTPALKFGFTVDNGQVEHKGNHVALKEIKCKGDFSTGIGIYEFTLTGFSAKLPDGSLQGDFSLRNPENPEIKTSLVVEAGISQLLDFFAIRDVEGASGRISADLRVEGTVSFSSGFDIQQIQHCKTSGTVTLSEVTGQFPGYPEVSGIRGTIVLDNNKIRAQQISGKFGSDPFLVSATLSNLVPFLVNPRNGLDLQGDLKISAFDTGSLQKKASPKNKTADQPMVAIPEWLRGIVTLQCDAFRSGAFSASGIRASVSLSPGIVRVDQLRMKTCDGIVSGTLALAQKGSKRFILEADLETEKTNISSLFRQFDNFGQDDLTWKELSGFLTGKIRFSAPLNPDGNPEWPLVEAIADLKVEEGVLSGYAPVMELSKYTRIEDLSVIRFHTLENQLRISGNKVIIPGMFIRSDAADFTISGTHSFNDTIDYHLSILLSEVLSRKAKQRNQDKEDLLEEPDTRGRLTLYLSISGTSSKSVVKYDRRAQRKIVKQELKTEKETVKGLFKKEFGTFIRQNPDGSDTLHRNPEQEILIEWEDE
ncbi:MAG TPA: AsmA-like C-terminal region-containing protein [Bacteroidales bacterium]|nr:AsmA-like C-terminal region-containing protein [Bacteroidales bacterium]HRZ48810.1 AsmA-like C-terminal region-containing protein [Bacteroidales bacterium]